MPRVSVVVPNYNHERFLARRIQSILRQTYRDFELIILDHASTDGSLGVLEQYKTDPRIRIYVNERTNGSPFPQWNRGVELANGEYVWIAESDDEAAEGQLEALVSALDASPSAVLAYCQSWVVDDEGRRLRTMEWWTDDLSERRWKQGFCANGKTEAREFLLLKNTIPNASAVVFRRDAYIATGGAPIHMRLCGDWMLWAKLAPHGDFIFIAEPHNSFRTHSGTVRSSTSALRLLQESLETILFIERAAGIPRHRVERLSRKLRDEWQAQLYANGGSLRVAALRPLLGLLWRIDPRGAAMFALFVGLSKTLPRGGLGLLRQVWARLRTRRGAASS